MEDAIARSTFEGIWEFSAKMDRAVRRCSDISEGERALGYKESADEYEELVSELKAVKGWQHELLQETTRVFFDLWHTYMTR